MKDALGEECPSACGSSDSSGLYASLIGAAWESLSPELREFHRVLPAVLEGRLEVCSGGGLAGILARWSAGMPTETGSFDGRLTVRALERRQVWERSFGPWSWISAQRAEDGSLVEEVGRWRLRFLLRIENGQLLFLQHSARLRLGRWSLLLPRVFAPRVTGRERIDPESRNVELQVEVRAPGGWRLVSYRGRFRQVETTP